MQRFAVSHIDHYRFAAAQAASVPDDISDVGDKHLLDNAARADIMHQG